MAIKLKNSKRKPPKEIENIENAIDLDFSYNEHFIYYYNDGSEKIVTVCLN